MKNTMHLCLILLLFVSCSVQTGFFSEEMKKHGIVVNDEWDDNLKSQRTQVKEDWIAYLKFLPIEFLQNYGEGYPKLTKADIEEIDIQPVRVYSIDSIDFWGLNKDSKIAAILTTDTTTAYFFGLKKGRPIVTTIACTYKNNLFGHFAIGVLPDKFADYIVFLKKNKLPYFKIKNSGKYSSFTINAFIDKNGELKTFIRNGKTEVLLDNLLSKLENSKKTKQLYEQRNWVK
jgi:hypothetical protein